MKRIVCLILSILLVVFISGCGGQQNDESNISPTVTKTESIKQCDHLYVTVEYDAPTCEEFGRKRRQCKYCNNSYYETLSPLGHDWAEYVSFSKSTTYMCKRCNETKYEFDLD